METWTKHTTSADDQTASAGPRSLRGLAAVALVFWLPAASAVVFTVDRFDDTFPGNVCDPAVPDDCSLRDAINNANLTPGPDIVELPAGTYLLTRTGANEDGNITGDLDISDTVLIRGAGMSATIIDAGGDSGLGDRLFNILAGPGTEFEDLTIQGGRGDGITPGGGILSVENMAIRRVAISDNRSDFASGGIRVEANLTIDDSLISDNLSFSDGGGIHVASGALVMRNSEVSDNQSVGGGGISVVGDMEISDSIISGNLSVTDTSSGGGIRQTGTALVNIARTLIIDNHAPEAVGGGANLTGLVSLDEVQILNNSAAIYGGLAVFSAHQNSNRIDNSTIAGNSSPTGAGLHVFSGGSMTITNTTITGNDGSFFPVSFESTDINLLHVTIFENDDQTVAGAIQFNDVNVEVGNSIFEGGCTFQALLTFISLGGNFESPNDTCLFGSSGNNVNVPDLMLEPLANTGGSTDTLRPDEDSVVIDGGNNNACLGVDEDQRGFPRQVAINGGAPVCDAGAVEFQASESLRIYRDSFES